jgi:uncharacterized protein (TIGR02145 family)
LTTNIQMKNIIYPITLAVTILIACNPNIDDQNDDDTQGVLINGVRWATTNVDAPGTFAAKPEDFGMFYQWGKNVGWSATDPLVSSNGDKAWDTNTIPDYEWAQTDDPCPDGWRVPMDKDTKALIDGSKVDRTWTKQGGVRGTLFVDMKTGKSIFLPAAGLRLDSSGALVGVGTAGCYWAAKASSATLAYDLNFGSMTVGAHYGRNRGYGFAVRCVSE